MLRKSLRLPVIASLLLACSLLPTFSDAARADLPGQINLERPGAREFVIDKAALLTPEDQTKIKTIADKLQTDKSVRLVVVTIEGMDKHGGAGLRIETFARLLFDQWEVGAEKINGQPWNYAIMLLVSKNDKKARIELGAGWRRDKDIAAQAIMQQQIIPRFRQGNFSAGIVAGVEALDRLARDLKAPAAKTATTPRPAAGAIPAPPVTTHSPSPRPTSHRFGHNTPYRERSSGGGGWFLLIVLVVGLGLVFMVVAGIASLFRSGGRGNYSGGGANYGGPGGNWGPGAQAWGGGGGRSGIGTFLGGAAAGVLGSTLYGLMNQRSHADSGHYHGQDLWGSGNDHGATGSFDSGSSSGFDSGSSSSFGDSGSSFGGGSSDSGGYSGGGGATGEW